ncbi:hypothetical protein BE20_11705 [Sorangium cellulosum]|nr:hypothetical protein BE20_11705 [Sorangium cellulosum]
MALSEPFANTTSRCVTSRRIGDSSRIDVILTPEFAPPLEVHPPFVWTPTILPDAAWSTPEPELPPSVSSEPYWI